MTQDEIIRMAREAGVIGGFDDVHPSIERFFNLAFAAGSAHEREKQAEQEPVAWMSPNKERLEFSRKDTVYGSHTIPLYTHPVRTKELTDDEICKANKTELPDCQDLVDFARAVIAADREKNR